VGYDYFFRVFVLAVHLVMHFSIYHALMWLYIGYVQWDRVSGRFHCHYRTLDSLLPGDSNAYNIPVNTPPIQSLEIIMIGASTLISTPIDWLSVSALAITYVYTVSTLLLASVYFKTIGPVGIIGIILS
jgi:hypothetical protein